MKARALVTEYVEQLRRASQHGAQEIDPLTGDRPRQSTPEKDWLQDAQGIGLSSTEAEASWVWFRHYAFEAPPVLEETEQRAAREIMPDSVRRVLTRNPMWGFVGYDPDILQDFGLDEPKEEPIPDDDERRFENDVALAITDPSNLEARRALDRLARLVHLKPEHTRQLAGMHDRSMEATKRQLVQEAVLFSLDAAAQPIRIGRRAVKGDAGHPITLEDVFGKKGLEELVTLAIMMLQPTEAIRSELETALGGPFRPAHLTDRQVYRNWLRKEIRLRTVKLLGQDLDIDDAGRAGGSRREVVSYDESEPLAAAARGWQLGTETQAFTDNQMRATGEREDQEKAAFRSADHHASQLGAAEKKNRLELALAHGMDWQRLLEQVRREHPGPVLGEYIDCVLHEPLLFGDDVAAARQLGWEVSRISDTKRRLNGYISRIDANQRWKSRFPNAL